MAEKDLIVGIDLGGTNFRACLADREGNLIRRESWPTEAQEGHAAVSRRLDAAVRHIAGPDLARVAGVGVGAPGPLDPWRGVIIAAPNLPGWVDVPLRDDMQSGLGLPVYLGNDANLAALGEFRFGVGRGYSHLVYITVSTGVGGGVIVDGRLLLGAKGLAAEIGHMVIDLKGPRCACGNYGCLEAMASGTAIAREARARMRDGAPTVLWELAKGDLEAVDAVLVEQAARAGDAFALGLLREAGYYLGVGVVNVLHLFDPEIVVVGGGVSRAGELIFGPLRETVQARAMPGYRERSHIVPAGLGDDAGLMGAVALVMSETGL